MNNFTANQNKPAIKLPPLGSLLQISRDRIFEQNEVNKYYNTPSSSSFNTAYHSPSMSDHDKSFKFGKFDHIASSETYRVNSPFVKQSPLTPPNVSSDSFSKYQSEESSQIRYASNYEANSYVADDTFYSKNSKTEDHENDVTAQNENLKPFITSDKNLKGLGIQYQPVMRLMKNKVSKKAKENKKAINTKGTFAFITHSSTSYSSKEAPSIDNEQLARQKRRRTDAKIVTILEECYKNVCCRPNKFEKIDLSQKTGLTFAQVQVWFQNRRSRDSKNLKKNVRTSEKI